MKNEAENIELRSEKIRNIIGQIPPKIIRYGISVLFLVFVLLVLLSYYFKFSYSINTTVFIKKENNILIGMVKVPANFISRVKIGYSVKVRFDSIPNMTNEFIECKIIAIPKNVVISKAEAYSYSLIQFPNSLISNRGNKIIIEDNISANAEIITEEISFFERIIEPLKTVLKINRI